MCRQPMPDVVSQMHPRLDGGNALMKALLEVTGLGLCCSAGSLTEFVRHTLLYCQSKWQDSSMGAGQEERLVMEAATSSLEFLQDSKIVEGRHRAARSVACLPLLRERPPMSRRLFAVVATPWLRRRCLCS